MNENYVVIKLVTGEQVMATVVSESDTYVELYSPITIKNIPVVQNEIMAERVTAQPFNPYSEDTTYKIAHYNIIYIKPLHDIFVLHYKRFVKELEETALVRKDSNGGVSRVEDLEELSLDEIKKRIDMLQSIVNSPVEEEDIRFWIEGTNTIN